MAEKTQEKPQVEEKIEKKESIWTPEEKKNFRVNYGCEILVEDGSSEQVMTKKAPTDCYIVRYTYQDKVRCDLTRGTKMSVFDMYWDKLKGGIQSIDYGKGTIKPNLWGYKTPQQKKKRKG